MTNVKIICFADETVILIFDKLHEELYFRAKMIVNHVISWFYVNLLELILNGTKYTHFKINNTNHNKHKEKYMFIHLLVFLPTVK